MTATRYPPCRYSVTLASSVAYRLPLQGARSGGSASLPHTAAAESGAPPDLEQGLLPPAGRPTPSTCSTAQPPQPPEPGGACRSAGGSSVPGFAEHADAQGTQGRQLLRAARCWEAPCDRQQSRDAPDAGCMVLGSCMLWHDLSRCHGIRPTLFYNICNITTHTLQSVYF